MIITLCNGKGGSGKTTLSVLLGAALVEAGHQVALLDTDPQHTATRWIEEMQLGAESTRLELAAPGKDYGALVIDTAPRLETAEVRGAVRRADVVVLVTSPSPADLFTSRDTAEMIVEEGAADRSFVLFNQVQPGTILARDLDDLSTRIGLPAFRNTLRRRQAYQHAVLLGWGSLGNEAREELFKVALEIVGSVKTQSSKTAHYDRSRNGNQESRKDRRSALATTAGTDRATVAKPGFTTSVR